MTKLEKNATDWRLIFDSDFKNGRKIEMSVHILGRKPVCYLIQDPAAMTSRMLIWQLSLTSVVLSFDFLDFYQECPCLKKNGDPLETFAAPTPDSCFAACMSKQTCSAFSFCVSMMFFSVFYQS